MLACLPALLPGATCAHGLAGALSYRGLQLVANQCQEGFCLFNISADPCEQHDLASSLPAEVARLKAFLAQFQATAVPPVEDEGCAPVIDRAGCWRPCDGL